MWSDLHAAAELGGLQSSAVSACTEVWDAVGRWPVWVTLARADSGLEVSREFIVLGRCSPGKAMTGAAHPDRVQLGWGGVKADLMRRERMRQRCLRTRNTVLGQRLSHSGWA